MKRSSTTPAIAAAAFASLVTVLTSQPAHAVWFTDPFGNASSHAVINKDPGDQSHWISWKNLATGQCAFQHLGNGGFSGHVEVLAFGGHDIIQVTQNTFSFCGFSSAAPNYNGFSVSMFGHGGDDQLIGDAGGPQSLFGGDNNDLISSLRFNANLGGGNGNDTLIGGGTGSGGLYSGEAGNDCLAISTSLTPAVKSCGSGTDTWRGSAATRPDDCEAANFSCCPFTIC